MAVAVAVAVAVGLAPPHGRFGTDLPKVERVMVMVHNSGVSYPPMPMKEAALSPADLLADRALVRRRWSRICMVAALAAGVVAVIGIGGRASGWLVVDVVTGQ